jgi:homoserine O-succinyltransferase
VTSILCSCLATHAIIHYCYGVARTRLQQKRWGVFSHTLVNRTHPLVVEINTRFDVPHSRFNEIFQRDMEKYGLQVLVASAEAGVHLATSEDGFRIVFFQGHPEYDDISLLKEYKREVLRFYRDEISDYPQYPEHYFNAELKAILHSYTQKIKLAKAQGEAFPEFPEHLVRPYLDNTWRDTAKAVFNNWLGKIYQITHQDRRIPFMDGIDPKNPLEIPLR